MADYSLDPSLSPAEKLKAYLAGMDLNAPQAMTPASPMASPNQLTTPLAAPISGENPYDKISALFDTAATKPAELPSPTDTTPTDPNEKITDRPSKDATAEHGAARGITDAFQTSGDLLKEQAKLHSNNAMDLLRKALASQAEVSPSQALAAGLLAIVPTIGGYIAGKSIGSPKLSPHLRLTPDQLTQNMTGGPQGAMFGLTSGASAAEDYLKGFDTRAKQNQAINVMMAQEEAKQASPYQSAYAQNIEGEAQQQSILAREKEAAANKPDTVDERATQAWANYKAQYPNIYAKMVAGQVPLTEQEAATIPPSLAGKTPSFTRNTTMAQRIGVAAGNLDFRRIGGYATLAVNSPDSLYKPKNPDQFEQDIANNARNFSPQAGEKMKQVGVSVENGLNQLEITKQAVAKYGMLVTEFGKDTKDPNALRAMGQAIEQIHSGEVQLTNMMGALAPLVVGNSRMTDSMRQELGSLGFTPTAVIELDGIAKSVQAGLQDPGYVAGKIDDAEREIGQRFGDSLDSVGLKYAKPIAGFDIISHRDAGGASPMPGTSNSSLQVGGVFNGKKILSVEKVQ